MYFGTWMDVEGEYSDTAHFTDCLQEYPSQGGGCYLLLSTVEVDYHFPTVTISNMSDAFYSRLSDSNNKDRQYVHIDKLGKM